MADHNEPETALSQLAAATTATQRQKTYSILSQLNRHVWDTQVALSLHILTETDDIVEEIKQEIWRVCHRRD